MRRLFDLRLTTLLALVTILGSADAQERMHDPLAGLTPGQCQIISNDAETYKDYTGPCRVSILEKDALWDCHIPGTQTETVTLPHSILFDDGHGFTILSTALLGASWRMGDDQQHALIIFMLRGPDPGTTRLHQRVYSDRVTAEKVYAKAQTLLRERAGTGAEK